MPAPVVGYDYRPDYRMPGFTLAEWDERRRRGFLLRPEVPFPLSADSYVWPEALDTPEAVVDELYDDGSDIRNWPFDLRILRRAIAAQRRPGVLIALTEHCAEGHLPEALPAELPRSRSRLGFDVVDQGGLSGLMSYGFSDPPVMMRAIHARFTPHLNSFHLFTSASVAASYAQFMDSDREPGSGPFCVIGLWLLAGEPSRNGGSA